MINKRKLGLKFALHVANLFRITSVLILGKTGETISGRVLIKLCSNATSNLSLNRRVIIVSGTNGKTSTTKFLATLVVNIGTCTTNSTGSNLNWGVASALMKNSEYAVLEVDELHLIKVMEETKPEVVLLLNLTRDQLHRMHEVKRVAGRWHESATNAPETTFVIDVDDPFLNYATKEAAKVIKISFGGRRHPDGSVCPSCGKYMNWNGGIYDCACGLTNKHPDQIYPDGSAAYRNATLANIAAGVMGAAPLPIDEKALERSAEKVINGVRVEIRLTKNPASWTEALKGVDTHEVILVLNARQVDGIDTSWLWDVSFASLRGKRVVVTGERALDIAYRLHVEGIEAEIVDSFDKAIKKFPRGSKVSVLAAYTAFFGLVSK